MTKGKIFISYSSKDKEFATQVASSLKEMEIDIWFDEWEIKVGDSIIDRISTGIEQMRGIAVVLSKHSVRSNWVRKELNSALLRKLSDRSIHILPLLLGDCKIPMLLAEYKYADFRHSFNEGFEQFVTSLTLTDLEPKIVSRPKEEEESSMVRFSRLHSDCWKAFSRQQRELLLLVDIILEACFEFSRDEEREIYVNRLSDEDVRGEVADFIIDKLITDPRSDHEGIEAISAYNSVVKKEMVKQILHFDKDLFCSRNQPWRLMEPPLVHPLWPPFLHDFLTFLFNELIPSQLVTAIGRFATNWTDDIKSRDYDLFYDYLASTYPGLGKKKDMKNTWTRWCKSEGRLKSLVFCERIGRLSPALFSRGGVSIKEVDPIIFQAIKNAFGETNPLWA